jgi:Zn-dependent protease
MSHSYVAMKYGTKISSITLFIFGGVAMMEDVPREPEKEWRIAIAGPAMSFAIGGLFLLSYLFIKTCNLAFYLPRELEILSFSLGVINLGLAAFNLLPAYPMDGGRILRSFFARKTSFLKATKKAAFIGKTFAIIMGIVGLMPNPFLLASTGEIMLINPWLTMIAIFLYMMAKEEESAVFTCATLEGIKVKHVMRTGNTSVSQDMPITELIEKMLLEKTAEYAVVSESGELKGFVTFVRIKELPADKRSSLRVSDVINSSDSFISTISLEEEAMEALKRMTRDKRNILAVEKGGSFVGIITINDLANYIEMLKGRV